MKIYKVYCLKNRQNEIMYVGQTRQSLSKRLTAHKSSGRFPHRDYTIELIADFDDPKPMYGLEAMLIEHYDLVNNGWNKEYGKLKVPKQISQAGEHNQFYKHSHTEENRQKISERNTNNQYAKGNKSRTGRTNSEEHKKAVSDKVSKAILCVELNIIFKSAKEAAKQLNLMRSKISNVCHGKRKTTGGYTFCFVQGNYLEINN